MPDDKGALRALTAGAQVHHIPKPMSADEILWVDTDMQFPEDALLRLLAHDKDIVGCNYRTRTPPYACAGIYQNGVMAPGEPHNPAQNFALAQVFKAINAQLPISDEELGQNIRAQGAGTITIGNSSNPVMIGGGAGGAGAGAWGVGGAGGV